MGCKKGKKKGGRKRWAGLTIACALFVACGIAKATLPDGRPITLTGYDYAETNWGDGVYQITLSESNPYDRVERTIRDTEFGNDFHEVREIDPNTPARAGLWRDLATGLLGFLGGLVAGPVVAP